MRETPRHLVELAREDSERVPRLGLGFLKTTVDPRLHRRLLEHLRANIHNFKPEPANDYLLTESKRFYPSLLYHDEAFNQSLLSDLQQAHEEWSGLPLKKAACYGVRVYQPGSYLHNHVDRARTHVVSCTICIDRRLSSRWPFYIEDVDGRPHEVSIEPGEIVFYESARLRHGRPYALDGEYYASIFVHYTPINWTLDAPGPLAAT